MASPKPGGGQLVELVAFDRRLPASDGYGNTEGDFEEVFQCRAGYTWLRGGETVLAARMTGRQPILVRVRRAEETLQIRPDWQMRDLDSGFSYAVHAISESLDRGYLDILVEQGVAA